MKIFIQELNGKIINLDDVARGNTIENIKMRILAKEGIIPDQYKLIFSGTELEDNRELIYYNIQNESNIQLVPIKFKIFVDYLNNKKIEIDVEYSDTIGNIKQKIKDKEENLPNYYRLTFDTMELKNNLTLKDYNIDKNCAINLIKINTIQIFVENLNGKKIVLEVEYSNTIEDIKNQISFKEGIFSDKYELLFDGIKLENNKTLKDYNINENSIIYLQYDKNIKIFIEMNEKKKELNVETSDTIYYIKRKLDKSISSNKIKLIFNGIKLEDEKTLENYNISNNSIIYFKYYRKFKIFIVNEKKKFY
jgi:ubiquitin C